METKTNLLTGKIPTVAELCDDALAGADLLELSRHWYSAAVKCQKLGAELERRGREALWGTGEQDE